jgi:membrane protein YqaA with SNARE-associated domain
MLARQFAVFLGVLAFTVTQVRAMVNGFDCVANLWQGLAAMAILAGIGGVLGAIAEWMLGDSLRIALAAAMAEKQNAKLTDRPRGN